MAASDCRDVTDPRGAVFRNIICQNMSMIIDCWEVRKLLTSEEGRYPGYDPPAN